MRKLKCARRGCDRFREEGSDLCQTHTNKYYGRNARRYISIQHVGTGGGQRIKTINGEGWTGSRHSPKHDGATDE